MSRKLRDIASLMQTVVLTLCAVAVAGVVLHREFFGQTAGSGPPSIRLESQPDWQSYALEGRRIGSADAPAVLVGFSDYECPACASMEASLQLARSRFGDRLAIVMRHFPLEGKHKHARAAAIASECAGRQGRFKEMHESLFTHRDSIGLLSWQTFAERAGEINLSGFEACLKDPSAAAVVDADKAAGQRLGVQGTPTILVSGVKFGGTLPQPMLDSLIALQITAR